jgi:LacI family transcriptional regulator
MADKQEITIHDIARRAGVSPSTVSRVVNGNAAVSPDKRQAVLAAIEALHYRPNIIAQGLARGRSRAVGVLVEEIGVPYFGQFMTGVENGLAGSGLYPIFTSGSAQAQVDSAVALLADMRIGALIVVSGWLPDDELTTLAQSVPTVVVGRCIAGLEGHCLEVDNAHGAYRGTRHLVELGHRHIALISGRPRLRHAVERRTGYGLALSEGGLAEEPELVVSADFDEDSGLRAAEELLQRHVPFTAIFAESDRLAYGAALALHRAGLKIPDDVSLVGFDDLPLSAFMNPPLTTVRQHLIEMGRVAARAVLSLRAGDKPQLAPPDMELVVRASTAPAQ